MLGTINADNDATYDKAVTLLNEHFAGPQSVLLCRFIFRRSHQLPGESVHQYVANLRGLANSCKFGALRDKIIRDQLIEHTNTEKIWEVLLLKSDDLSLSRAIAIAYQVESAAECAATLANQTKPTPSLLAHMDAPPPMDQSPGRPYCYNGPVLQICLIQH